MNTLVRHLNENNLSVFRTEVKQLSSEAIKSNLKDPRGNSIFHHITSQPAFDPALTCSAIYILCDAGFDVNCENNDSQTCLHLAVKSSQPYAVVKCLLQNGSDLTKCDKFGLCSYNYVKRMPNQQLADELLQEMKKFYPTYWMAIDKMDITLVRRLVNCWCKFTPEVLNYAEEKGFFAAYELMQKLKVQMELCFAVLAHNVDKVAKIIDAVGSNNLSKVVNVNFKNMNDRFATLKYYAIAQNSYELVDMLASHLKLNAFNDYMFDEHGDEMPVLFKILSLKLNNRVVKRLFEAKDCTNVNLANLRYKGLSLIRYLVEIRLNLELFEFFLHEKWFSYEFYTLKDPDFLTPLEYCESESCDDYLKLLERGIIDAFVNSNTFRQQLVYDGFELCQNALTIGSGKLTFMQHVYNEAVKKDCKDLKRFLELIESYQDIIKCLHEKVELGHINLDECITFEEPEAADLGLIKNLIDSKTAANSQSVIHRAVLNRDYEMLKYLLTNRDLYTRSEFLLDNLRDHCGRTPLHYAYGTPDNKEINELLVEFGFSENVFDKDGKSPLDFQERIVADEVQELVQMHRLKNFNAKEPDPWSWQVWTRLQKEREMNKQIVPFVTYEANPLYLPILDLSYHRYRIEACGHQHSSPLVSHVCEKCEHRHTDDDSSDSDAHEDSCNIL